MALLGGLYCEQQSASANKPHQLSFATARAAANDTLFEIWNGTTNAARRFVVDKDGKPYSNAWTAGDMLYAVAGGVTGVRLMESLAKGTAYQQLRMNSGATAPEWGSGRVVTNTTAVSTSGTGEDDLISYTLAGGVLAANGQVIRVTAWGEVVANAGTVTLRFRFGTTGTLDLISSVGASNDSVVGPWHASIVVVRTSATGGRISGAAAAAVGALARLNGPLTFATMPFGADAHLTANPFTETLSGSVVLKMTGECSNGADQISQDGLVVEFLG